MSDEELRRWAVEQAGAFQPHDLLATAQSIVEFVRPAQKAVETPAFIKRRAKLGAFWTPQRIAYAQEHAREHGLPTRLRELPGPDKDLPNIYTTLKRWGLVAEPSPKRAAIGHRFGFGARRAVAAE